MRSEQGVGVSEKLKRPFGIRLPKNIFAIQMIVTICLSLTWAGLCRYELGDQEPLIPSGYFR